MSICTCFSYKHNFNETVLRKNGNKNRKNLCKQRKQWFNIIIIIIIIPLLCGVFRRLPLPSSLRLNYRQVGLKAENFPANKMMSLKRTQNAYGSYTLLLLCPTRTFFHTTYTREQNAHEDVGEVVEEQDRWPKRLGVISLLKDHCSWTARDSNWSSRLSQP